MPLRLFIDMPRGEIIAIDGVALGVVPTPEGYRDCVGEAGFP
jgi:hypothetical protein